MNILIIDDDEYKRGQIMNLLVEAIPDAYVEEARSLQSGLKAIMEGGHNLVVLDMTMPTFDITAEEDGGRPQAFAGRELLKHMKRRRIEVPSVVVTQFDRFGEGANLQTLEELDRELRESSPEHYCGTIHFNVAYDSWKEELKLVARRIHAHRADPL